MVAHNCAAQGGRNGNHQHIVAVDQFRGQIGSGNAAGEHRDDDGQQDGEGAPGGAGGETQERGDQEYHGGQEVLQAGAELGHQVRHKLGGAEGLGHIADGPGQAQDQDGGHHLLEAVGQAVHQLSEAHGPAHHEEDHGKDQGNQGAERQGVKGGGIGEGGDEVGAAVLVAHIDHGAHAAPHQHKHRQYQINDLAIGIELHLFHTGKGAFGRGVEVALGGVVLMLAHGTVVDIQAGHHNDEHQGQNGVIVVGDGFQEDLEAHLLVADDTGDSRRPGGDGHHNAHRGRSGVAHIGQLGAGDVVAVGDGPHHITGGQVIEVVVHAQHDGQDEGGPQGAGLGLDMAHSPVAIGLGAAGPDHQGYHGAQNDQEHQNAHVAAGIGCQAGDKILERINGAAVGIQEAAHDNAQEQRRIHFLGDQSQDDGRHRREQGCDGAPDKAGMLHVALGKCCCHQDTCKRENDQQELAEPFHTW